MNVTVNQIRQEMTTLVQAHEMVNSFFWGDFHRSYNEQTPLYPLVCSYLTYNTMLDNMSNDNLVIIICDKTYKDYSNLNDTESDTKQVARHLFNVIRQSPRWNDLLRVNSATMSKFIDDTSDEVAGVILTLNVNLKSSRSLCDLPLDNYSFEGDFEGNECEPVLIVNSNQTFTFSAASGTIVELSDTPVLVTDLEGNPLGSGDVPSVTGGTIQVDVTPPPCDPSDVFINGVEIGTTTNGEQFDITVEQSGVEVGSFVDGVWVVPECAPCDDASFSLVNTDATVLDSGTIPSGASANIVAPDGTANVTIDGSPFQTVNIPSGGSATIDVPSWTRPTDWLVMPTVLPTEQTFVGLHAIFPSGNNFAAFRFTTNTGDYQVDWGDGTITTHASNTTAEHTYNYATYDPSNATLSTRGYKQAMIVVTPLTGDLTTCNFQFRRTTTPAQNQAYATGFLDCILSMPNATTGGSIVFGGTIVRHAYVERFDVKTIGNCTSTLAMFRLCFSLQSVPLFNTQNVTNMTNMFIDCLSLQTVPLFNTQNVTTMESMFGTCISLQTVPLFNTQNVTNMSQMLRSCSALKTIPLFNTQNVTNMFFMFQGCNSLQTVPPFNTQNVTDMGGMFNGCNSLQTVPLFNTQNVTNMLQMFTNCSSLQTAPNFNTTSVTNQTTMFQGCNSFDRTDIICRVSVSFQNCQLSRNEIVNIFNNLLNRTAMTSANINITGNWGVSALTAGDLLIATNKNWTVTT